MPFPPFRPTTPETGAMLPARRLERLEGVLDRTRVELLAVWNQPLVPVRLWLRLDTHHWVPLATQVDAAGDGYRLGFDLLEAGRPSAQACVGTLEGRGEPEPESLATGEWLGQAGLYVQAQPVANAPGRVVPEHLTPVDAEEGHQFFLLGRAAQTRLALPLSVPAGPEGRESQDGRPADEALTVEVVPDRKGFLRVRRGVAGTPHQSVLVSSLRMEGAAMVMRGELRHRHSRARSATLELTERGTDTVHTAAVELGPHDAQWQLDHYGHDRRAFTARFDFTPLLGSPADPDTLLDARLRTLFDAPAGGERVTRVGRTGFVARQCTNEGRVVLGESAMQVLPYYTAKAKNTSFRLERFTAEGLRALDAAARRPLASYRPVGRAAAGAERPVWLVGEQPEKAQDNGAELFRYLRRHRRDIGAYYVLAADSPDAAHLAGLDHVVEFRSPEHVRLAARAQVLACTHHADYILPTRSERFQRVVRATRVFLQHGVIAMKWMKPLYGVANPSFSADLFMVSSEREKEFIVGDLGYAPERVPVTGLSRFDNLFDASVTAEPGRVLVMPTWRDWLQTDEAFLESAYLEEWGGLLRSEEFADLVREHGLDVTLLLHPNMSSYRHHFDGLPVRVLIQGETNVQQELRRAAALVTDYSSVSWDFSFQHRPVYFFHFDAARMFRKARPHADLAAELPGPVSNNAEGLLASLCAGAEQGFRMDEAARARADRFVAHRDRHNSERVVAAIEGAARPALPTRPQVVTELRSAGFRRFRRSRVYHPLMRRMYAILSKLPPDPQLVVFEAGLGRQVNDSPKAIYDELVRRGDARRKVWSTTSVRHFAEPSTSGVLKLSPRYFWTMARASTVVTNQNLPFYITRGPGRTFIQTWHGTPLKRMAGDLETVHGRTDGYLERVRTAAAQWSVLVSPNEHTTACLRSAYGYQGEAVYLGYPRHDSLLADDSAARAAAVRRGLGIAEGKRAVLYAPTFRDNRPVPGGRYAFDLPFDPEEFHRSVDSNVVLLLRTHVLAQLTEPIPEHLAERIVDVSAQPDIDDLYLAADALVTDYSSVFFDYSLLKRPMVFFAPDLSEYREDLRGFYLDYEGTVPGPVVTEQGAFFEAVNAAAAGGEDSEDPAAVELNRRFNPVMDGAAAARTVDRLMSPPAPSAWKRLRGVLNR